MRVYVVWTPVLSEDDGKAADKAVEAVPDDRAMHFWDDDKSLGFSLGKTVSLPRGRKLAWDVYFAFDAKAKWGDAPPNPGYWMHQLANDDRKLDGEKLKDYVLNALAAE
ncbi:MAG: hypothetical protein IH991_08875 [Planctomycetes bacterium]|nr:hypothetical protein [Planctomycetota bacterium]